MLSNYKGSKSMTHSPITVVFGLFILTNIVCCSESITMMDGSNKAISNTIASIDEESTTIDEPIEIGGSFLTCISPNDGQNMKISCHVFKNSGKQEVPAIEDLWLEGIVTKVKTEANFQITEQQSIEIIPIYEPEEPYQVVIKWEDGEGSVAEVQPDPEYRFEGNLVQDGSFETISIVQGPTFYAGSGQHPSWDVVAGSNFGCINSIPELEIQTNRNGATFVPQSSEGNQHLELDSRCSDNSAGGNVAVYQDLKTIPGHIYTIEFDTRARDTNIGEEAYVVMFGDEEIHNGESMNMEWQKMSFQVKATKETSRILFEEMGTSNSMGTLIDNIEVFDLGLDKNTD